jgi:hypothetical protein
VVAPAFVEQDVIAPVRGSVDIVAIKLIYD